MVHASAHLRKPLPDRLAHVPAGLHRRERESLVRPPRVDLEGPRVRTRLERRADHVDRGAGNVGERWRHDPHRAERDDPKDLPQAADQRDLLGRTLHQDPAERVAHLRLPQVGDRLPHIPHEPVDEKSLVVPLEVDFAVPQQDVGHHGTTSARSSATARRSTVTAASISSVVVKRDRLNRRVDWASAAFSPIASNTWLAVGLWLWQAEPVDTNIPSCSSRCSSVSPRTLPNVAFTRWGAAPSGGVLIRTSGIARICSRRRSCSARIRAVVSSKSAASSRAAAPRPAMPGTFSVPGRTPRSCSPPPSCGASRTPALTYKAPTPFGPCTLWPRGTSGPHPTSSAAA